MKNRILMIISNILKIFSAILVGIIITRYYSDVLLGTYQQGTLLFSTLYGVVALGLPKAVIYFVEKNFDNPKNVLYHIIIMLLVSIIFFILLLFFIWNFICDLFSNPNLIPLFSVIILNLALRTLNEIFISVAIVAKKQCYIWNIEFFSSFIMYPILGMFSYLHVELKYLFLINALIELIKTYFLIKLVRYYFAGEWLGMDFKLCKEILLYSFPLVSSFALLVIAAKLDSFLISSFMLPETYAVYSRGAIEIPFGKSIIFSIGLLLMPKLVRCYQNNEHSTIIEIYHTEIIRGAILIIPMFFSFLLIHVDLILLFYTKKYIASTPIFALYISILPLQLYCPDLFLQALNKTKYIFYIALATVLCNLLFGIYLIPSLGLLGPALGTFLSTALSTLIYTIILTHVLKIKFQDWLPWKKLFKTFTYCFIIYAVFYKISSYLTISLFFKIALIWTVSYLLQVFALWKNNVISIEDKNATLEMIKKIREKYNFYPFIKK